MFNFLIFKSSNFQIVELSNFIPSLSAHTAFFTNLFSFIIQIVKLPNRQIVELSHCQIISLSNCRIISFSNRQIVPIPSPFGLKKPSKALNIKQSLKGPSLAIFITLGRPRALIVAGG